MFSGLVVLAAGIVLIPHAPLGLITTSVQALAGVLLPSATVFLLLLCNDKEVLGPWVNRPWLNVLAGFIVAVLLALSLILMATTVFPHLDVTHLAVVLGAAIGFSFLVLGAWMLLPSPRRQTPSRPLRGARGGAGRRRSTARNVEDAPARPVAAAGLVAGTHDGDVGPPHLLVRGGPPPHREGRAARDRALSAW